MVFRIKDLEVMIDFLVSMLQVILIGVGLEVGVGRILFESFIMGGNYFKIGNIEFFFQKFCYKEEQSNGMVVGEEVN